MIITFKLSYGWINLFCERIYSELTNKLYIGYSRGNIPTTSFLHYLTIAQKYNNNPELWPQVKFTCQIHGTFKISIDLIEAVILALHVKPKQ